MIRKTANILFNWFIITLKSGMIICSWIVLAISVVLVGTPAIICLAVLMIFTGARWSLEKLQKINDAYDACEPAPAKAQSPQLKNDGHG